MSNRRNPELFISFYNDYDDYNASNVLTADGKLMTNRIRNIIKHGNKILFVDPRIGSLLLKKLLNLKAALDILSTCNSTTDLEIERIHKKARQTKSLYIALFGTIPSRNNPFPD